MCKCLTCFSVSLSRQEKKRADSFVNLPLSYVIINELTAALWYTRSVRRRPLRYAR